MPHPRKPEDEQQLCHQLNPANAPRLKQMKPTDWKHSSLKSHLQSKDLHPTLREPERLNPEELQYCHLHPVAIARCFWRN